jgi:hypothetical protein
MQTQNSTGKHRAADFNRDYTLETAAPTDK